jgi:hypothetical protein
MAVHIFKDCKIYTDGVDLTGLSNSVSMNITVDLKDKTVFGSSYTKRIPGLSSVEISGGGFYDASTGDKTVFDDLTSTSQVFSVIPEGTDLGNVTYSVQKVESEYSPGFQIGEVASINFACYGDGTMARQKLLEVGSLSTALSATVRNIGVRSSTKEYLYAVLQSVRGCTAAGQDLVMKVQTSSSSGFGSYTTSLKFTTLTTANHTAQWKTTQPSTAQNWYRVAIASSGSTDGTVSGMIAVGIQ